MMIVHLLKPGFATILLSLLITLQISTAAAAANPNSGKKRNTTDNYTAVIRGTDSARINEDEDPDNDGLLEASGKLNITDYNSGEDAFIAETMNGNYGYLVIAATGNWYYAADNNQAVIQSLSRKDSLTDTLVVSSIDGTTHPVKITIKGVNDTSTTAQPAVISGSDSGSVTEDIDPDGDGLLETGGKLDISDNDAGEAAFIARTRSGNFGSLSIDTTGNWSYAAVNTQSVIQELATGETLSDTFTVSSVDGSTHAVHITIHGADEANQPALISGTDSGRVTEDVDPVGNSLLETSGKLDIIDNDAGEAAFIGKNYIGSYGSLTMNTDGNWHYAADNNQTAIQALATGETVSDTFTVSSVDGTKHAVRITIHGVDEANQPAIISGTDSGSVTEDVDPDGDNLLEVGGKLNVTDNDAGQAAFIARTVSGSFGSLSINTTGSWNYAAGNTQPAIQDLATGASLTDTLTVSSVDGTTHTVVITIRGTDEADTPAEITVSWIAPAEREDSSTLSLSAIAGYRIYYGTTSGTYTDHVIINDGSAISHTFNNLVNDTYYFVLTTIDSEGRESQYSTEVAITM